LKSLLETLGFEFLVISNLEEVRTQLDPDGKSIHIDKLAEWI